MPLVGVRHELVQLRTQNPHWSLGDLAAVLHVSRERVRQLLVAEGMDTRRRTPKRIFAEALQAATEQEQARTGLQADDRSKIVMPLHNAPPSAKTVSDPTGAIAEPNSV